MALSWPAEVLLNVNFPDRPGGRIAGVEATRMGRRKIGEALDRGVDPRGNP